MTGSRGSKKFGHSAQALALAQRQYATVEPEAHFNGPNLLLNAATPGAQTLAWDGRDAQGRPAPAGVYAVELGGQHQSLVRLPE